MHYYQRLKDLREDNDLSQEQIAKVIGTYQTHYSKYERGEREIPFHQVIKLAKYYNVSIDYIAGLTNEIKPLSDGKDQKYTINQENSVNAIGVINITERK